MYTLILSINFFFDLRLVRFSSIYIVPVCYTISTCFFHKICSINKIINNYVFCFILFSLHVCTGSHRRVNASIQFLHQSIVKSCCAGFHYVLITLKSTMEWVWRAALWTHFANLFCRQNQKLDVSNGSTRARVSLTLHLISKLITEIVFDLSNPQYPENEAAADLRIILYPGNLSMDESLSHNHRTVVKHRKRL